MLLDFTVENFRSIKGAETLSAVAANKSKSKANNSESRRRVKSDDEIAQPFHVEGWDIDVLPVIAIFGANASGKSNILKALNYLLKFMSEGNYDHGTELIPFKLDQQSRESPSCFRLRIVIDGTIYIYSLILNSNRILSEKLEYALASTKQNRLLYSRSWNEEHQKFEWKNGSYFKGSHIQLEKNIHEREPFTSLFSKLEIKSVERFAFWLESSVLTNKLSSNIYHDILIDAVWSLSNNENLSFSLVLENTKNLLFKFDTGLYDIQIKKNANNDLDIQAFHKTTQGEILSWKFEEESTGTQKLFNLACNIYLILRGKDLAIFDEIGANIHPNIIREIIKTFQSSKTNRNRTQLIFTSHDNTLQRNNLLRRDQIWFTQKRPDQSTELYPLSDFKVRNDLAIDKAYLDGRFGAVPFISDEDDFMPVGEDNG
ncbi:AAA family ATPase [Phormidium tenue]|uniref:ATP-binding protein n=1 Tax=Phormidium tenue FACHB-1050 TaxID=2692857 RepID=A0ABR8CCY4_9CYAN|nr:ATP-binding protein [Phormidium tenue]MBD2318608.1 ATP-binding protein [Phormidium tenue FACHB-1050]